VFRDFKKKKKFGLTKLGGQFWNIFFWADSTWGTVSGFQFKFFYRGNIKGTSFGLFLANCGLGTFEEPKVFSAQFETFGHIFFSLGTFERSIWSKAHFKGTLQGSLWSFFETPLSQSVFERPLKP
jgi:hypothetical protein